MDDLDAYIPLGWKRDLLHIVGCHYAKQVAPLAGEQWEKDSQAFIDVMCRKNAEWLDIKELHPMDYMSYVATVFKEVTGHYLRDLSSYTGWMRVGGYYHWKVAELGQLSHCLNLQVVPPPRGPIVHPSIKLRREIKQAKAKEAQQSQKPDETEATTSASRGNQLPASMDIDDLVQAEAGAGDSRSWYTRSIQEEELKEANKKLNEEVKKLQKALD